MTQFTLENLEAMSRVDLLRLAQEQFGVSFSAKQTKSDIVSALAGELGLDDPAEPEVEAKSDKVWLRIHRSDKDGEPEDVFVGANGKKYLIKRGEWVQVPRIVMNILRDAVQTVYDRKPSKGAPGRVDLVPREAESYPFETRAA